MIETKIKCNFGYHYTFENGTATLAEAVAAKWWELFVYCGDLRIRQPETEAEFHSDAIHACSAAHARQLAEKAVLELIPDETPEKAKAAPADSAESDIPY